MRRVLPRWHRHHHVLRFAPSNNPQQCVCFPALKINFKSPKKNASDARVLMSLRVFWVSACEDQMQSRTMVGKPGRCRNPSTQSGPTFLTHSTVRVGLDYDLDYDVYVLCLRNTFHFSYHFVQVDMEKVSEHI